MKNKAACFLFLWVLRCFTSPGVQLRRKSELFGSSPKRFPHSEISGSKVARHLPEAYRSHATSFIASFSLGIHHAPLNFLLGNLKITFLTSPKLSFESVGGLQFTFLLTNLIYLPACLQQYKDPRIN